MAHKYGGFLTISFCGNVWSHPLNPMGMMKRNTDLLKACKDYPEACLWLYKYTTSSCFYNNESVTIGPFISGLATNYVLKSGATVNLGGTESRFKNIKIAGTIDVKGTAGGLFGNVILEDSSEASAEIILDSDSISVEGMTEVSGYIAGGLFGEVSGNITMTLNSMPSVAAKVYGYYDGYKSPLAWKYNDGFISQMKICAGGLIGKMTNEAVLQTSFTGPNAETGDITYLTIKNLVISDGISGGLIGAVQNSTVNVACVEKDGDTTKSYDLKGGQYDESTKKIVWSGTYNKDTNKIRWSNGEEETVGNEQQDDKMWINTKYDI